LNYFLYPIECKKLFAMTTTHDVKNICYDIFAVMLEKEGKTINDVLDKENYQDMREFLCKNMFVFLCRHDDAFSNILTQNNSNLTDDEVEEDSSSDYVPSEDGYGSSEYETEFNRLHEPDVMSCDDETIYDNDSSSDYSDNTNERRSWTVLRCQPSQGLGCEYDDDDNMSISTKSSDSTWVMEHF
jgi:hypothetical protein